MRKLFFLVTVCLFGGIACGSPANQAKNPNQANQQPKTANNTQVNTEKLKAQAQEVIDAMTGANYDRAVELTHPKVVEMAGGRERLSAAIESEMKKLPALSIKLGEPRDMVEDNGESYAIVPGTMSMKVPEGALVGDIYMVAFSNDKGEHWTFVDGAAGSDRIKKLFPNVADRLRLPEEKRPVLQKSPNPQ